ncbi:EVE domain-containing protein [Paragemmobacter straminiformis]|uniref:EVE domain-containing protein n=1 Tax=Paragemmobacter straminiformis TaxID=2045119 RepID=A0A842I844_9RHOB|nr:EVE domain-containing protein [Gemmobacter straminiformis]MBC2836010.1 EVE domain-containing protein [Gemmobacter straminiformis]
MAFWLLKSEPDVFGWPHLVAKGEAGEEWSGVRNYQARNNMRAMQVGELAFFYHSNIGKEIVGVMEVIRTSAPDSTTDDPRWDCVMLRAKQAFKRGVGLDEIKATPGLEGMVLVKNSRLSVQPVTADEWALICRMGGL